MNKASRGDGISAELFQILKDDAVESAALKMLGSLENSTVTTGLENVGFHSNRKEGQCQRKFKLPNNCSHLTFQQGNAQNHSNEASAVHKQNFKLDLEKVEEPDIKVPTFAGSQRKQGNSRKTSASLTMLQPLMCGSQQSVENS